MLLDQEIMSGTFFVYIPNDNEHGHLNKSQKMVIESTTDSVMTYN